MSIELTANVPLEVKAAQQVNDWRIISTHIDMENRRVVIEVLRSNLRHNTRTNSKSIIDMLEGDRYDAFMDKLNPGFKETLILSLKDSGKIPARATES